MEARPPFRICAISAEIPLVTRKTPKSAQQKADWTKQRIWKDTSQTAYISGLYVRENGHVLMSYGSSDIDARLLTMSMAQLEELFSGSTYDCSNNQVRTVALSSWFSVHGVAAIRSLAVGGIQDFVLPLIVC